MNILFYVEPLIERSQPYWKEGWATYWCRKMGHNLPSDWNMYIALSDALAQKFGEDEAFQVVVFKQSELLKNFNGGFLEATSAWYTNSYTKEQIDYYIELMRAKLCQDKFDVIITFTPVPFLQALYPNARILHMEYSIFSRQPFPLTWYLDPAGLHKYSFLSKYKGELQNIELSAQEREYVRRLQDTCLDAFSERNIFKKDTARLREQYKFLVLLPVQFSQYYLFDCLTKWKSQFDYVTGCLEQIPHDIGVIFTMHPEYPIFDNDTVSYIKSIYPNAIFLENSRLVYSASQWLMPYIDGVINISSSLGVQTLLFRKKLFALGNGNMDYIADAQNLDNMYEVLSRENADKDAMLWFFITKYAVPFEYLFNGQWLDKFLKRSMLRKEDENFYDYIDAPEKIFQSHIDSINQNKKNMPQWVKNNKYNIFIPSLYILKNGMYTEEVKIKPCEYIIEDYYTMTFNISGMAKEGRVRFDPVEGEFCRCEIVSVEVDGKTCDVVPFNAYSSKDNQYVFLNTDPVIEILGDFTDAEYITITYKNTILESTEVSNAVNTMYTKIKADVITDLRDELWDKAVTELSENIRAEVMEAVSTELRAIKSTKRYNYAEKAANLYYKIKQISGIFHNLSF